MHSHHLGNKIICVICIIINDKYMVFRLNYIKYFVPFMTICIFIRPMQYNLWVPNDLLQIFRQISFFVWKLRYRQPQMYFIRRKSLLCQKKEDGYTHILDTTGVGGH